ncbi:MAG: efflux RND transporter periplasmic adaptor subunit [Rhizobiaceae bacterium]
MRNILPVFLIAVGALLLFAVQSVAAEAKAPVAAEQAAPAIRVVAADTRELVETLHVNGTVLARQEAMVSTDLNGLTVMMLQADRGDMVKKGQLLATLDRTPLEVQKAQISANRAQAEAGVAQARSQITDAEVAVRQAFETWERVQVLKDRGHATQAQLDNAVNAHDSAKARLNTAHMALKSAEAQIGVVDAQMRDVDVKLGKTAIKAPADGLVLSRNVTLGGVVSAQSGALFRIAIDNELELAADVAEFELPRLTETMAVDVTVAGSRQAVRGEIRLIAPEVDQRTRLGRVLVRLPENAGVRVGNFASGKIEISRTTGVAVPETAVVYRGSEAFLQKVENGIVSTVAVVLGSRADGHVQIVSGIEAGDEVVYRAGTFVADGDRVLAIRDQQTGAVEQ